MPTLYFQQARFVAVTGSHGLIGTALTAALIAVGYSVRRLDLRGADADYGDISVRRHVERAIDGCVGVVHLAAVSRVVDGERDPAACWRTNVAGTRNVLDAALAQSHRPWVLYASSREVYGQPLVLPACEDTPRSPINTYGWSKLAAEDMVRAADLPTAIVRFSNVYGWSGDHPTRVVPAFARQAALGRPLRVDGGSHTFDFTHLSDTIEGVLAMIERLETGGELPPIHLVTGVPTSLAHLATLAVNLADCDSLIEEGPPRSYDVAAFYGEPCRAAKLLSWHASVSLRDGLARLISEFRAEAEDEPSTPRYLSS